MEADGNKSDKHRCSCRQGEDPPGYRGTIGEALQPGMHGIPGDGGGDEQRDEDQPEELFRQESYDSRYRCAEHLADADLAGALDGAVGRKAEQSETADEDSEQSEIQEHALEPVLAGVELGKIQIHEGIFEGPVGDQLFPALLEGGDGAGDMVAVDADGDDAVETGVHDAEADGHDLFL